MKKFIILSLFLISSVILNAQSVKQDSIRQPNWFERVFLGKPVIVHDTVYVISEYEEEEGAYEEEDENGGSHE